MSDDRDETRPLSSSGDGDNPPDDATRLHATDADSNVTPPRPAAPRDDATRLNAAAPGDDATRLDIPVPGDDVTRPQVASPARAADATRIDAGAGVDATVADPSAVPPVRETAKLPDATSVMPPADDWAPGRGNAAWTGRAEVRAPRPGGATYTEDEWAAPPSREPRERWWMPILIGVIALLLLAALGFGIYLIVQNSGNDSPAPAPTVSTLATQAPTTTAASTPPTTEPTTQQPTTAAPTTAEPAVPEVQIPALAGLSLEEAQAALARSGLQRYKAIYRDNDAPPGTVIGSDPAEGQEVPPDTTVTLVISQGNGAGTGPTTTPTATPGPGGN